MTLKEAREIAAQCWTTPDTSAIEMNVLLAEAFALELHHRCNAAYIEGRDYRTLPCKPLHNEYDFSGAVLTLASLTSATPWFGNNEIPALVVSGAYQHKRVSGMLLHFRDWARDDVPEMNLPPVRIRTDGALWAVDGECPDAEVYFTRRERRPDESWQAFVESDAIVGRFVGLGLW